MGNIGFVEEEGLSQINNLDRSNPNCPEIYCVCPEKTEWEYGPTAAGA